MNTPTSTAQLTIVTTAIGSLSDDSRLRRLLASIRQTGARICCMFPGSDLLTVEVNEEQGPLVQAIEDVVALDFRPST